MPPLSLSVHIPVISDNNDNLALGQPTYVISLYSSNQMGRLVDGYSHPNYTHGHCLSTNEHKHPWWMVDLGESMYIYGVAVVSMLNFGKCVLYLLPIVSGN